MTHQTPHSPLRGCLLRSAQIILGLGVVVILFYCGVLFWWAFIDCAPGRNPAPYPNTTLTEQLTERTAVIKSQTRTISYTVQLPIERLIEHYAWEMRWTCQYGSVQALAPVAPGADYPVRYHAQCYIKGWQDGGHTFHPEGGYSFKTVQQIEIDATLHRDGTIEVQQREDFAEGC